MVVACNLSLCCAPLNLHCRMEKVPRTGRLCTFDHSDNVLWRTGRFTVSSELLPKFRHLEQRRAVRRLFPRSQFPHLIGFFNLEALLFFNLEALLNSSGPKVMIALTISAVTTTVVSKSTAGHILPAAAAATATFRASAFHSLQRKD